MEFLTSAYRNTMTEPTNPQPLVNDVLEASGISDLISVQHDEATALAEAQA